MVNLSTHHRSELVTVLTTLGTSPPPTDLVTYYLVRSGQMSYRRILLVGKRLPMG